MPPDINPISGSFRDPSGHVFRIDGAIIRSVSPSAASRFDQVLSTGIVDDLIKRGLLVETRKIPATVLGPRAQHAQYALEHAVIPYVTYPYEWSFQGLKAAALRHLEIHRRCLDAGVTLSDASAYNMQFVDTSPVFIDALSLVPYADGAPWAGHRQFCEQFLNPLLLRAWFGVPHHAWYRGSLEGIPTADIAALGRMRHRLSVPALSHVFLPAWMGKRVVKEGDKTLRKAARVRLPKSHFAATLGQLERWIGRLEPKDAGSSSWGNYAENNTYTEPDLQQKAAFVQDTVREVRPSLVFDLGCNIGIYSGTALEAGAARVIGFEADPRTLEIAFKRARSKKMKLLPLYCDAVNPSPDQGWNQGERGGMADRATADLVLALAFIHHLVIGRNVPLEQCVDWIAGFAKNGVVEFVGKSDPTVQKMLYLREDVFPDYQIDKFRVALERRATIVGELPLPNGRTLFRYHRKDG